jgi:hypothetical protein
MKMRSKHNVDMTAKGIAKRTVDGIVFDSELEANYYRYILQDAEITEIRIQPKYLLQESFEKYGKKFAKVELVADFEINRGYEVTVIDVKGNPTETAKLKRKLFDKKYKELLLEWVAYSKMDGGWIDYDTLTKLRKARKKAKG